MTPEQKSIKLQRIQGKIFLKKTLHRNKRGKKLSMKFFMKMSFRIDREMKTFSEEEKTENTLPEDPTLTSFNSSLNRRRCTKRSRNGINEGKIVFFLNLST